MTKKLTIALIREDLADRAGETSLVEVTNHVVPQVMLVRGLEATLLALQQTFPGVFGLYVRIKVTLLEGAVVTQLTLEESFLGVDGNVVIHVLPVRRLESTEIASQQVLLGVF